MKFRADIEGLRALAIVPVVLYHAYKASAPGGFIGVDVFFVISGYLITGIIVSELKSGEFSLSKFYKRRVSRIFPALFFMLLVTCMLAPITLAPAALAEFGRTLAATVLFSSNWQFMQLSNYFDIAANLKPLLHTWSLAVEEQFYVVFPLFLIAVFRWSRGRLLHWLVALTVLALFKSLWAFHRAPLAAFYLAPNRAIELLIGALPAVYALPRLRPRWRRELATGTGLLLILGCVIGYDDMTPFPGWHALVPCVGAALIIYGGRDGESTVRSMLTYAPVRYIGVISYALYLWHWPLLVFARHLELGDPSGEVVMGAVAAAFLLAAFSARFIERPFRRAAPTARAPVVFAVGAACVAGAAALGVATVLSHGLPQRFSAPALTMFEFSSHFNPRRPQCHGSRSAPIRYEDACRYGAAGAVPSMAVWGDSYGAELAMGLGEAAAARGEAVLQLTSSACPPALGYSPRFEPDCGAYTEATLHHVIADDRISEVVLVANYQQYLGENWPSLTAGLGRTISALQVAGKRVTLQAPVPNFHYPVPDALGEMVFRHRAPSAYGVDKQEYLQINAKPLAALLRTVGALCSAAGQSCGRVVSDRALPARSTEARRYTSMNFISASKGCDCCSRSTSLRSTHFRADLARGVTGTSWLGVVGGTGIEPVTPAV